MNWNTFNASTQVMGTMATLSSVLTASMPATARAVTLAFATRECGAETWAGISPASFRAGTVLPLAAAGIKYVISTGGAAGAFTCASPSKFVDFVRYYATPQLVGIDFDIEAGQTATDVASLVAGAKATAAAFPALRLSFTIATLGSNTTTSSNLNAEGDAVVKAIASAGLCVGWWGGGGPRRGVGSSHPLHPPSPPPHSSTAIINLMVMDYGAASPYTCVVNKATGACDMGASAVAAATSLATFQKIPFSRIELTPMIGGNDVQSNVFSLADAATISAFARTKGLAGIHYWSFDRDRDCPVGPASSTCNSVGNAGTLGFLKAFLAGSGL
jgi:hypothetical protein